MKHYYGNRYLAEGIETVVLIPLSLEAVYKSGYYDFQAEELVIESKDRNQVLKIFNKMDDLGKAIYNVKNFPLYERRMIEESLNFRLKGEALEFFIENFVENSNEVLEIIDSAVEKYKAIVETNKKPVEKSQLEKEPVL